MFADYGKDYAAGFGWLKYVLNSPASFKNGHNTIMTYETRWCRDVPDLSGRKGYNTSISIIGSVPKLMETHINIYTLISRNVLKYFTSVMRWEFFRKNPSKIFDGIEKTRS